MRVSAIVNRLTTSRAPLGLATAIATLLACLAPAGAVDTYQPQCFAAAAASKATIKLPAKPGPYRIAFANGFIGNGWRVQMIQTLKAYAAQPEVAKNIKELRIVSVGTDVSAQIAAMDNFISSGFDAIIVDANSPTAFKPVLRRARQAGILIVSFDNIFDGVGPYPNVIQVNEDQREMGRRMGQWLDANMKQKDKVLEVRGVPGNSVDRDRHEGFHDALAGDKNLKIVEVVGNWDDGTGQKATADAISINGGFDGIYTQGGSTGVTNALLSSGKPLVPIAGEGENGYRKLIVAHSKDGLLGDSAGQSPALVAVSLKAAIAALQGNALPQQISVPIPEANYKTLAAGKTYFPDLSDTFFAASDLPVCAINLPASDITGQSSK